MQTIHSRQADLVRQPDLESSALRAQGVALSRIFLSDDVFSNLEQYGKYLVLQFEIKRRIEAYGQCFELSPAIAVPGLVSTLPAVWDDVIDVLGAVPVYSEKSKPCDDMLSATGFIYASELMCFFAAQALGKNNPLRLSNTWGARHLSHLSVETSTPLSQTMETIRALDLSVDGQHALRHSIEIALATVRGLWAGR